VAFNETDMVIKSKAQFEALVIRVIWDMVLENLKERKSIVRICGATQFHLNPHTSSILFSVLVGVLKVRLRIIEAPKANLSKP